MMTRITQHSTGVRPMRFFKPLKRNRRFKQVIPRNWMPDAHVLEELDDGKVGHRQGHSRSQTRLDRMLADLEKQEKAFDGKSPRPAVFL